MAGRKGKGSGDARGQGRRRLNVWISHEAHERLGIHCVKAGATPGKMVEDLVLAHLRTWTVRRLSDRTEGTDGSGPADPAPSVPRGL